MALRLVIGLLGLFAIAISGQRVKFDRYSSSFAVHQTHPTEQFAVSELNFTSFRLPNTSIPTQYRLHLDTNVHVDDFQYSGRVEIQLTTMVDTDQIVLHSSGNSITSLNLLNTVQLPIALHGHYHEEAQEFLVIVTKETLPANTSYRLVIEFTNHLRSTLTGFYRTSYKNETGSIRNIAVTQFEPTYARSAFPCYDEPWIRATFDISISCGFEFKATSNMPIAGIVIQENQKKTTRFQVTPRMPTYLVAFMVTDFSSKRVILKDPTRLTMEIFARPTATNELQFSLEKGVDAIRAIERYFNQSYTLPKLDQVAVPEFQFIAMENWGLVKYEEPYLLFDELKSSNLDKENIVATIVHEFVHQFFGNLVTPKWWTDIFLNEGFATLYEFYIAAEIEPSIRFKELFAVQTLQGALLVDSTTSSRPLSYYRETNLMTLFDKISYNKGGSVFRMMSYALGERTFQKGLRRYLATNKDSSVEPGDLFESLQSAAKEDAAIPASTTVGAIMDQWVYQSGYPLVTVQRHSGSNETVFKQEHFSDTSPESRTWWIPISYRISDEPRRDETETRFWMPHGTSQVSIELNLTEDAYLLVNPHQTGYYRVNYDTELWHKLIDQLKTDHLGIPPVSRAQLLDDSFKLSLAGLLDVSISFELFSYLSKEVDFIPWYTALKADNLQLINEVLVVDEEAYDAFKIYCSSLLHELSLAMGFEGHADEPHEYQNLRSSAIEWSCRMGAAVCRNTTHDMMVRDLMEGTEKLPSYIKHSVYCGGLMDAAEQEFDAVFNAFKNSADPTERAEYISALGCNENRNNLLKYLDFTLNPSHEEDLIPGEPLAIMRSVYTRTNIGFNVFMAWLETNPELILEIHGQDFISISNDINNRKKQIESFEQLIALLKSRLE